MHNCKMGTYSGKVVNFVDFDPSDVCIEDIAHHLALINRYNGASRVPYSVAEHCARMSAPGMPGDPLTNLLHDAAEAYVGDIISPQKQILGFVTPRTDESLETISFREQEEYLMDQIYRGLGHDPEPRYRFHEETKKADGIMYATEVRDLICPKLKGFYTGYSDADYEKYSEEVGCLPEEIVPWSWRWAEHMFLHRYWELTKNGNTKTK